MQLRVTMSASSEERRSRSAKAESILFAQTEVKGRGTLKDVKRFQRYFVQIDFEEEARRLFQVG